MPRIVIVKDYMVSFQDKVLTIQDEQEGEPQLTYHSNYTINQCNSYGYGLMSPSYSRRINQYLFETDTDETILGINIRYAWTKGMLFTYDFVAFAKLVKRPDKSK